MEISSEKIVIIAGSYAFEKLGRVVQPGQKGLILVDH